MRKLIAAVAVMVSLAAPHAYAAINTVISGPAAASMGYATPLVFVDRSQQVTYANLDVLDGHNVVSVLLDAFDRHIFSTPIIRGGQTAPIAGVAALAPGDYAFYCTLHPNMTGTLRVGS